MLVAAVAVVEVVLMDLDETLAATGFLREARHHGAPLDLLSVPGFTDLELHPGIEPTLTLLGQRFAVGLVTSSPRWYVDQLLGRLLPGFAFCSIVTYEDVASIKPDPEPILTSLRSLSTKPCRAVYVGDDLVDHQAAVRAGVAFVGAAWAEDPNFPVEAAQARHPLELLDCLESLIS